MSVKGRGPLGRGKGGVMDPDVPPLHCLLVGRGSWGEKVFLVVYPRHVVPFAVQVLHNAIVYKCLRHLEENKGVNHNYRLLLQ